MRSAPARPCAVRALCEAVAVLLSKNMTCTRPRCNATSSKHFPHTSHCTLHTSHLSSSHLVSCLPICQLRSSWLFSCHLSAAQTFSCVGATFNLSRALLHVSKVERNSSRFFCMPKGIDHNIFTILRSFMPSVDALHQIATASVNMV